MIIINEHDHTVQELITAISRILRDNKLVSIALEGKRNAEYVINVKPFIKYPTVSIDLHLLFDYAPPIILKVSVWRKFYSFTPSNFDEVYTNFIKKLSFILGKRFSGSVNSIAKLPVWDIDEITEILNKILLLVRNYKAYSYRRRKKL